MNHQMKTAPEMVALIARLLKDEEENAQCKHGCLPKSVAFGHPTVVLNGHWFYVDTGRRVFNPR